MVTHPVVVSDAVDPAQEPVVNDPAGDRPAGAATSVDTPVHADTGSPDSPIGSGVVEPPAVSLVVEERFAIVPEWLLDADVSDAAVRLYAVLLRYGQSSGRRMPSRRVLAARLRKKSVDSVDRAMKELVAIGAVVVQHRREGGVNLTNRYVIRSTPAGSGVAGSAAQGPGAGGRTGAATRTGCEAPGRGSARTSGHWGGRNGAAGGGRRAAAGVAAQVRPNPEQLTQSNTPPPQPSVRTVRTVRHGSGGEAVRRSAAAGRSRPSWAQPRGSTTGEPAGEVVRLLGPVDLEEIADQCRRLRHNLGLPARLWTVGHLEQVVVSAVRDHGRPADAAVPALLAIAADPATRSPARLSCPGPWWDTRTAHHEPGAGSAGNAERGSSELEELEQRLAETDGARVALQRRARDLLLGEGRPVTRLTVARRAVQLLEETRP